MYYWLLVDVLFVYLNFVGIWCDEVVEYFKGGGFVVVIGADEGKGLAFL